MMPTDSPTPRDFACVFFGAIFLLLPFLGTRDFFTAAEGRPALVAREMLATGEWQPPHLHGRIYLDKPPFYHGLVALTFKAFGTTTSESVARLPSVFSGALCAVLVFAFAAHLFGRRAALFSALLFLFDFRVFENSRTSELEILLALSVGAAIYGIHRLIGGVERRWRWYLLIALGSAVATVSKGPALALLFPLFFVVARMVVERRFVDAVLAPFAAVLIGTIAASIAYWGPLLAEFGPDLFRRMAFANVRHHHFFLYYVLDFPGRMAPTAVLLPLLWPLWKSRHRDARTIILYVVIGLFSFSVKSSKQSHYLLPLDPILAVLFGKVLLDLWTVGKRYPAWLTAVAAAVAPPISATILTWKLEDAALRAELLRVAAIPAAFGLVALVCLFVERSRKSRTRTTCVAAATVLAAWTSLLYFDSGEAIVQNRTRSAREAMTQFAKIVAGRPLATLDEKTSVVFYINRLDLSFPLQAENARKFLEANPTGYLIVETEEERSREAGLDRVAVKSEWRAPMGDEGWRLLGPGLAPK